MGKQFAIGDVHGCFDALQALIEFVEPSPEDQIVMLGDYVDRGPDSDRVIQWLIENCETRDLICLKGNHEIMMLEARQELAKQRRWGMVGGAQTWDSYVDETDEDKGLESVPAEHWEFLENLLPYYETESHVFVHACAYGDVAMADQPDYVLFWESFGNITARDDGRLVVCGHTSQKDGIPKRNQHAICIDTNACRGGWLTCLDVVTKRYCQANQSGETRDGWLDDA